MSVTILRSSSKRVASCVVTKPPTPHQRHYIYLLASDESEWAAQLPRSFMILDIYLSCLCFRHTGTLFVGSIKCVFCTLNGGGAVLPFQYRTPTSKWGQSTQITNKLSPIRDCGPKGVKARSFQVSATSSPEGKHYIFFCCFSFPLFLFDLFLCFLFVFFSTPFVSTRFHRM